VWQARLEPRPAGDGTFVVEFTPPASGVYSAYLAAPSLGLPFTWFGTLRAQ
jgi:hypothetical protein